MIKNIVKDSGSFVYLLKGMRFIGQHKSLLKYSIIQVGITCLNFILSLYFVITNGKMIFDEKIGGAAWLAGEWYLNVLYFVLIIPFFLILLVLSFYLILLISQIIIAPFNAAMSEKVEELYTGRKYKDPLPFFRAVWRDIRNEIIKVLIFLAIFVVQLPLLLIPGIGAVLFSITLVLSSMFTLTFDLLDYPMERDNLKVAKRFAIIRKNPGICFGYGGIVYLIFLVPLVNILIWPVLITSGTLLYIDKFQKKEDE